MEFGTADLGMCCECFNVAEWLEIANASPEEPGPAERGVALTCKARRLFKALKLDVPRGLREFGAAVEVLLDQARSNGAPPRDNRVAWAQVLGREFADHLDPSTRELAVLPFLVRFYLSIADGSCNLERALGRLVELLGKHNGPLMPDGRTMWSLLEVVVDGPSSEAGVFQRPAALDHHGAPGLAGAPGEPDVAGAWAKQHFVFTPFSRMCAKLWLQRHGRRFGAVAKPRSDKGVARDPQVGTCAAIVASRRAATKALVAQAAAGQAGDATIIGARRAAFVQRRSQRLRDSARWNPGLERFHRLTKTKDQRRRQQEVARDAGRSPYVPGPVRSGGLLGPAEADDAEERPEKLKCVAWPSTVVVPPSSFVQMVADAGSLRCLAQADLIVTEDLSLLDTPDPSSIKLAVLVVGLGINVLQRKDWPTAGGERPDRSPNLFRHQRAALKVPSSIRLDEAFAQRHPKVCAAIRMCAAVPGSQWKMVDRDGGPTHTLGSIADVAKFIQSVRRMQPSGIAGGSYVARRGGCPRAGQPRAGGPRQA